MGRSRKNRTSRALVVVLVVAAGVGTYAGIKKMRRAEDSARPVALDTSNSQTNSSGSSQAGGQRAAAARSHEPMMLVTNTPVPATRPAETVVEARRPATLPVVAIKPPTTGPTTQFVLPPVSAAGVLADAKAKAEAGDPVTARGLINEALINSTLSVTDVPMAKEMMATLNKSLVLGPRAVAHDPYVLTYTVQSGDRLAKIASANNVTWEVLCRVNNMTDARRMRAGQTLKILRGPFHAVVTKSTFTMDLYLGAPGGKASMYVMSFPVGLGKDDSTPTGTWMIEPQKKLRNPTYYSPRGEGIIAADDPKNPLGDYWLGLAGMEGQAASKVSYGIHGTVEPDSIGKMASMGCIRMRNEDVAVVFELLVDGRSTVIVKD